MTVEEQDLEARSLPRAERGQLIANLLDSLGQGAYEVSDEEVAQRVVETDSGKVEDISHDELLRRLNA